MRGNSMATKKKKKQESLKNKTVTRIAISAMIVAIIAIMSFVPYVGYIGIPAIGVSITIIHVAVLFFAWMFGWKEGLIAGLAFGVFSMIRAIAMPNSPIDPLFANPLVSVFPRVTFGFIAGILFDLTRLVRRSKPRFFFDVLITGIMTVFHSVLTLSVLFALYHSNENLSSFNYFTLILTIVSINGALELGTALIVTPLLILALDKAFPQYQAVYHSKLKARKKTSVYDTITLNTHEELLENLAKFVAINSVYDETTVSKENPFGKGVSEALDFIATLAKKDGFKVTNYANKVVEILCGEGKNITILAHADVVPAGTGWNQNPFKMVDHDDRLTGRGVADDKGPLLAAYYAMRAVRDNHLMGNYQIRFIVGGNEESGSAGVEYYFKALKKPQPDFGFSPDAEFPLIFAEKGIINFEVKSKMKIKHIDYIKGGVASNSVIEKCEVSMDYDGDFAVYLKDNKYDVDISHDDEKKLIIVFKGKAAHGASPEEGVNAGMIALSALANYYQNEKLISLVGAYSNLQGYGIDAYGNSDEMGHNSVNVGTINYDGGQFSMIVNFRYVDTCNPKVLKDNIKIKSKPFSVSFLGESPLLYYPKDSVLVSTLLKAYQEESGDANAKPKAIGGGTYAKEANNIVAFGAEFPGWNSKMHSPGEQVKKADLFKSISIYAKAIVDLGKKLNEN